jgi:hypothetical protein
VVVFGGGGKIAAVKDGLEAVSRSHRKMVFDCRQAARTELEN